MKLLGKGELKSKLDITVYAASASARAAVEKAGGSLTDHAARRRPKPRPEAATLRRPRLAASPG